MKYKSTDFTEQLQKEILKIETELQGLCPLMLNKYQPLFAVKGLEFDIGFDRKGVEFFEPGYSSSISFAISENNDLIEFHLIPIWECHRTLLGFSVSKRIPGSSVYGELVDEGIEQIKEEIKEIVEEFLDEESSL